MIHTYIYVYHSIKTITMTYTQENSFIHMQGLVWALPILLLGEKNAQNYNEKCVRKMVLPFVNCSHTSTQAHKHACTHTPWHTHTVCDTQREGGRERERGHTQQVWKDSWKIHAGIDDGVSRGPLTAQEGLAHCCLRLLALRYHAAAFFWTCAQLMTRVLIMM